MNIIRNILAFLISSTFSFSCHSQSNVPFAKADIRESVIVGNTVTIESKFKNLPVVEPHIAAHPTNNDHLLAAAMIVTDINRPYESCRLSSFVSQDGGATWQENAHDYWGYDPWVAILPNGQTAMSWIGTPNSFQHKFPIQFFSSHDAGLTWSDEVQTLAGNYDGTKITALDDGFYFTTVRFRDHMGADVILCHRKNEGPFEEVAKVDGKGKRLNFCEPAICTDGTVIVPASDFLKKIWVHSYHEDKPELSRAYPFSLNPGGGRGYMRLAADTGIESPYKDRVYFVRAVSEGVLLNYSSDKGQTWSADARVDLFENPLQSKAQVASVAVNSRGVLGISWVDSQENTDLKDVYFTISLDGGMSFQRPVRVTDVSTDPKTQTNGDVANKFSGGGHYLGLTARANGSFQLIWSDSRSGIFELQTCNVSVRKVDGK